MPTHLAPREQALLAGHWEEEGRHAHGCVAAFGYLALGLMAAGAPAMLVERAHRSALDAVEQARRCFTLASAYLGGDLGPGPTRELLPRRPTTPTEMQILELLTQQALALGQERGFRTIKARLCCDRVHDRVTRKTLQRLADDSERDAELAWDVLAWTLLGGGQPTGTAAEDWVRDLKGQALLQAAPAPHDDDSLLHRHGYLTTIERVHIWQSTRQETIERTARMRKAAAEHVA